MSAESEGRLSGRIAERTELAKLTVQGRKQGHLLTNSVVFFLWHPKIFYQGEKD